MDVTDDNERLEGSEPIDETTEVPRADADTDAGADADTDRDTEADDAKSSPKVRVRPKGRAVRAILAYVSAHVGELAAHVDRAKVGEVVNAAADALYADYEANGTVPTREGFAGLCEEPSVGHVVLTMPEDPFARRPMGRARVAAVCAGLAVAALLVGGGIWLAASRQPSTGTGTETAISQTTDDEKGDAYVSFEASADGWDADGSTPVIAHVEGAGGDVDFYTAVAANEQAKVKVGDGGDYTVTFISPVNADGSIYRTGGSHKVTADEDGGYTFGFEKVDASQVTADDLNAIAGEVAEAVKKGDSTLTGDAGAEVVKKFEDNIKKNPNADAEAVDKVTESAQETAKDETSEAKGPETSGGKEDDSGSNGSSKKDNVGNSNGGATGGTSDTKPSGGNSGSNSGNSGSSKKDETPAHQHNWVPVTKTVHHDAEYKTVHHDAEYKTVHHDAEYKTVYVCNNCGAQLDTDAELAAHMKAHFFDGCGSYHTAKVVTQQAYDEQVLVKGAWDEQVLVKAAWDETVTTGYRCSTCGATK